MNHPHLIVKNHLWIHKSQAFLPVDKLMQRFSPSVRVYIILIVLLSILGAANAYLPQGTLSTTMPDAQMPASSATMALVTGMIMLVVYDGLGFLGLHLSQKLGFPEIWDAEISNRQRFLIPALLGVGVGVFLVFADMIFQRLHTLGALPHPPFPTSIVASASAGIGEEVIFRLFFISFWVWLVSSVILKGRWQDQVFWIVAVFSALAFAAGHFPALMFLYGFEGFGQIPSALVAEVLLLNGVVSIIAATFFRKYGFLAAVGIHFWTDIVWHVVWGRVG
jgi:hypothetical protein